MNDFSFCYEYPRHQFRRLKRHNCEVTRIIAYDRLITDTGASSKNYLVRWRLVGQTHEFATTWELKLIIEFNEPALVKEFHDRVDEIKFEANEYFTHE